jgi:hypothetical protein
MSRIFFLITLIFSLATPFCAGMAEEQAPPEQESAEVLFLQWVNEARANPWAAAEELGLNVTQLRNVVDECLATQWDNGLQALEWNEQLALAAAYHVEDMLNRIYYSHISPDCIGPEQRIRSVFYDPLFCAESLGAVAFTKVISDEKAARIIYEGLLTDALWQGQEGAPLLDPLLRDIGLYLGGGQLLLDDSWYNVYILTCDLGRTQEPAFDGNVVVWGHVFNDHNGNGRYDQGEGIEGCMLTISGWPTLGFSPTMRVEDHMACGPDGRYLFELIPGSYTLTVEQNGEIVTEADVKLIKDPASTSAFNLDLAVSVADI